MIFNDDFITKVCADLNENRPVRYKFPLWGRIHIDRRLPFLCIYRRPAGRSDKGTERLLLGQASYILLREEDADCSAFRKLVKAIMTSVCLPTLAVPYCSNSGLSKQMKRQRRKIYLRSLRLRPVSIRYPVLCLKSWKARCWRYLLQREVSMSALSTVCSVIHLRCRPC